MSKRILIVDDDRGILSTMSEFLQREGYQILQATNGREALHQLREERPDILLSDVSMPEIDGMELLEQAHTKYPSMPIMLITGFGSISLAVEAMKKGAQDFVIKPLRFDELLAKVRTMSELCDLKRENASLRKELNSQYSFENIIGQSPKLIKIFEMLKQVSPTDTSILIRGEAGTGKELIAKAIHSLSNRSERHMVKVNCAVFADNLLEAELFGNVKGAYTGAIRDNKGRFELADNSTLFLDEIGDITPNMQVKLLRVLAEQEFEKVGSGQTMKVDVRIVAATNRNLEEAIKDGSFREDLFYRLNVIPIDLPPLRERREDIPLLVSHFLDFYNDKFKKEITGVSDRAMDHLIAYQWPGNIRELRHAFERAVILCSGTELDMENFPPEVMQNQITTRIQVNGSGSLKDMVDSYEKQLILKALAENNNNKLRTAKVLQVHRSTFMSKLKAHGIQ